MDHTALLLFIPTFFMVSVTPGINMTFAMTLGMSIGVRKSLWMMVGELIGVGLVTLSALIGVATILLTRPHLFLTLKYIGGAYLFYLGIQMWRSRGKMAIPDNLDQQKELKPMTLAIQGFVAAIANPKGWAFMVSLLPPFINPQVPLYGQAVLLISIILTLEFSSLLMYAKGGSTLRHFLQKSDNVKMLNKIAGSMMMLVGVWLVAV